MTEPRARRLAWEATFLAALTAGQSVRMAAKSAGIASSTAYWLRNRDARFARDWEQARLPKASEGSPGTGGPGNSHWRKGFLEALAETSSVTASAARVNVPARTVYKLRRQEPEFAAQWREALYEGYDNLEIEVLGYLRDPAPTRKMDVAAALRLLVAHRETVARERALREDDDEQAVLDSIDAFIEDMRQRRLANTAILAEAQRPDDEE
jgi:hypothetical protein